MPKIYGAKSDNINIISKLYPIFQEIFLSGVVVAGDWYLSKARDLVC